MVSKSNRTRTDEDTMKRKSKEKIKLEVKQKNTTEWENGDKMKQHEEKWFLCPPAV